MCVLYILYIARIFTISLDVLLFLNGVLLSCSFSIPQTKSRRAFLVSVFQLSVCVVCFVFDKIVRSD